MVGAEAEASVLLESLREDMEEDEVDALQGRKHGNATGVYGDEGVR